ncbi:MAG: hypothetical protein GY755_06795 [Chloroflexi bacterium]|nr:hypothetical protein [Chloroflexota bacterium]
MAPVNIQTAFTHDPTPSRRNPVPITPNPVPVTRNPSQSTSISMQELGILFKIKNTSKKKK